MKIRLEIPADIREIHQLTQTAFADAPHSDGTEAAIIDALRDARELALSLVAIEAGRLVGHIAFSRVTIGDGTFGWYGLGPLSVRASERRKGIGGQLVTEGLRQLVRIGAWGCVVLGDPAYYGRFGFTHDPDLRFDDAPEEYFMARHFDGPRPKGPVTYHKAFYGA